MTFTEKAGQPCERMTDRGTGIEFMWCPSNSIDGTGDFFVKKDTAFQQKGKALGLKALNFGIELEIHQNPIHKKLLLELCKSEGMDPEALVCLNLLLEEWFHQRFKRRRNE